MNKYYYWKGLKDGQKCAGYSMAKDKISLGLRLNKSGIKSVSIKRKFLIFNAVSSKEIDQFTYQLAILCRSGMPLAQALNYLIETSPFPLCCILQAIQNKLLKGDPLSVCLKTYPKLFNSLYCQMVEIGELSGSMEEILLSLLSYREKSEQLSLSIKKALWYPSMVLVASLLVGLALLIFIVPQFALLFAEFHASLPILTQVMLALSNGLRNHSMEWLSMIFMTIAMNIILLRQSKVRHFLHAVSLKLPIVGQFYRAMLMQSLSNTLLVLLKAGIPIVKAISFCKTMMGNTELSLRLKRVERQLHQGQSLYSSLANESIFPQLVLQMIKVGEETAELESILQQVRIIYETKINRTILILAQSIEPLVMALLSLLVGTIVIAMYLPIFELGNVI